MGWHWLTKLYKFQVDNYTAHHLYTVLCVYYPKSSLCLSPLISPYPVPPPTSPSPPGNNHLVVCIHEFYFPFFFPQPPSQSPMHNTCQPLPMYDSVSISVVNSFCSMYEWSYMVLFLTLISVIIMLLRSNMLPRRVRFLSFYGQVVFHCVNKPQLFFPLTTDKHLGCFQILAIVNNATMNIGVHILFWISVSSFFRYIPRNGITGS